MQTLLLSRRDSAGCNWNQCVSIGSVQLLHPTKSVVPAHAKHSLTPFTGEYDCDCISPLGGSARSPPRPLPKVFMLGCCCLPNGPFALQSCIHPSPRLHSAPAASFSFLSSPTSSTAGISTSAAAIVSLLPRWPPSTSCRAFCFLYPDGRCSRMHGPRCCSSHHASSRLLHVHCCACSTSFPGPSRRSYAGHLHGPTALLACDCKRTRHVRCYVVE